MKRREFSGLERGWRDPAQRAQRRAPARRARSCSDPRRDVRPGNPDARWTRLRPPRRIRRRGESGARTLRSRIGVFALIQLVPYGRDHANPAVIAEPVWKGERTRELFLRGCRTATATRRAGRGTRRSRPLRGSCSATSTRDATHLNVSQWGHGKQHGDEAASMLRKDEMPPWFYRPAHPEARLTEAEKQELIRGLVDTFGEKKEGGRPD